MMKMETDKIIDEQANTNTQVSLNFINISEAENMIRVNKKKIVNKASCIFGISLCALQA